MNNLQDGTGDFSLGQDSWHSPNQIRKNQYASGVNLSSRGGVLSLREGFHQLEMTFEDRLIVNKYGHFISIKEIWEGGKFQALIPFYKVSESLLITIISGFIFKTNIHTNQTFLVSETITVNQYVPRINWSFAGSQIVIFDYPDYPIVISDTRIFRCDPNHLVNGQLQPQVPISSLGTFNENRLFVANAGAEFTASDAVGNLATPEAPITFAEVFTPSSPFYRQFFSLPTEEALYPIVAMGFIQQLDSNTGVGPMFVATNKKFYFFLTNQPRDQWGQSGFGGTLLSNAGLAGSRSFVNVNSDLVFLSSDGQVHAISTARNEVMRWGNVPISREVNNFLIFHDSSLKQYATLGYFDNRIFITANPYRVPCLDRNRQPVSDYAHGGLVVLETENIASLLAEGTPTWTGLWTGINPMDMTIVDERFFVISKDGDSTIGGINTIYEINKDVQFKPRKTQYDIVRKNKRQIRSRVYTRSYNFDQPFTQKRLQTIVLHMEDLGGKVKIEVDYKPTHSTEWLRYGAWEHDCPTFTCDIPADALINGIALQQIEQIIFGDPEQTGFNPLNDDEYATFRAVQLRLTIEGEYWSLNNLKISAEPREFLERADTAPLKTVIIGEQCNTDWNIPEESLCPI